MSLSEAMSGIELGETLKPEIVRSIQMALYYDFVLYNMQQKPFYVLLSIHGGAIKNSERGFMKQQYNASAPMITIDIVGTLHNALVECLKNKSTCNVRELQESVEIIEQLYNKRKIEQFKELTKSTPAELYDLLNPGDGDINAAIQNAAKKIMAYAPSQQRLYLGDDDAVFQLIFKNAAVQFLDSDTVAAIRSIMEPEIALPQRMGGRRTRRRGAQQRGAKRHNRRSCKNKKRTRRHQLKTQ